MARRYLVALLVVVAVASLSAPGLADKTTVDPNSSGVSAKTAEDEKPDPRLAQKITYDSGSKRLHVVVEEIGRLAGMNIGCGNNKKDWQVRDIPVIVCVKDMPLGKLLRAIADATHTWFASEKIGDDPQKTYRIYRRHTERARIDSYFEEKRRHRLAVASWQWDALAACGRSERNPGVSNESWLSGKVLAQLGPGAKEKVVAGEELAVGALQTGCAKALGEVQRTLWEERYRNAISGVPVVAQDLSNLMFELELREDEVSGKVDILCSVLGFTDSPPYDCRGTGLLGEAPRELEKKGLGVPPYPEDVNVPDPQADMANSAMTWLGPPTNPEWDRPVFRAKMDVDRPADVAQPLFADAVRAIATASGLNVIIEDFVSQLPPRRQKFDAVFSKDAKLADCLHQLKCAAISDRRAPLVGYDTWFLDREERLLIGWADDGADNRWRDHQKGLLSENYVSSLKSKFLGAGLDIDDAAHLAALVPRSLDEWVYTCDDTPWLWGVFDVRSRYVLWRLYDSLEPDDKLAAKSAAGLALAKLDQALIESVPWQKLSQWLYTKGPRSENMLKYKQDMSAAMQDPKVISSMVMRLRKVPLEQHDYWYSHGDGYAKDSEPAPPALGLHYYEILVNCTIDGQNREFSAGASQQLPIRSAAREAEIIAAAAAKEKGNQ